MKIAKRPTAKESVGVAIMKIPTRDFRRLALGPQPKPDSRMPSIGGRMAKIQGDKASQKLICPSLLAFFMSQSLMITQNSPDGKSGSFYRSECSDMLAHVTD